MMFLPLLYLLLRNRHFTPVWIACVLASLPHPASYAQDAQASPGPQMLQVDLRGGLRGTSAQSILGMPVHWGRSDAAMLEPNGFFHLFTLDQVVSHQLLDLEFRPQTLLDARVQLQGEMGRNFETFVAGPYVIATPEGEARRWQSRFTSLLSGYTRYFEVRGWPLRKPDFPLIVVVLPDRASFLRYCATQTDQLPSQAVGSYFPKSNRCVLYQIPGARGTNWSETEATIVHEAVHQLAYNTGIHERLFENPLWFVEGLATMFEQPAVYELGVHRTDITSRMNGSQVRNLAPALASPAQLENHLRSVITSDALFQSDPHTAYAVSWALTYYLAERMPRQYQQIINLQSRRRFGTYTARQRGDDFQAAVGMDISLLSVQIRRLFQPK